MSIMENMMMMIIIMPFVRFNGMGDKRASRDDERSIYIENIFRFQFEGMLSSLQLTLIHQIYVFLAPH